MTQATSSDFENGTTFDNCSLSSNSNATFPSDVIFYKTKSDKLPPFVKYSELTNTKEKRLYVFFKCCQFISIEDRCTFATNYLFQYVKHLKEKHPRKKFYCVYCYWRPEDIQRPKKMMTSSELINHLVEKHGDWIFQCNQCMFRASTYEHVYFHQLRHHRSIYKPVGQIDSNSNEDYCKIILCKNHVECQHDSPLDYFNNFKTDNIGHPDHYQCVFCMFFHKQIIKVVEHLANTHLNYPILVYNKPIQDDIVTSTGIHDSSDSEEYIDSIEINTSLKDCHDQSNVSMAKKRKLNENENQLQSNSNVRGKIESKKIEQSIQKDHNYYKTPSNNLKRKIVKNENDDLKESEEKKKKINSILVTSDKKEIEKQTKAKKRVSFSNDVNECNSSSFDVQPSCSSEILSVRKSLRSPEKQKKSTTQVKVQTQTLKPILEQTNPSCSNNQSKLYRCLICDSIFSHQDIALHLKKYHDTESTLKCAYCTFYASKSEIKSHQASSHNDKLHPSIFKFIVPKDSKEARKFDLESSHSQKQKDYQNNNQQKNESINFVQNKNVDNNSGSTSHYINNVQTTTINHNENNCNQLKSGKTCDCDSEKEKNEQIEKLVEYLKSTDSETKQQNENKKDDNSVSLTDKSDGNISKSNMSQEIENNTQNLTMESHLNVDQSKNNEEEKLLICLFCDKFLHDANDMIEHIKKHFIDKKQQISSVILTWIHNFVHNQTNFFRQDVDVDTNVTEYEIDTKYQCSLCQKVANIKGTKPLKYQEFKIYEKHLWEHTIWKPNECKIENCHDKDLTNCIDDLESHLKLLHGGLIEQKSKQLNTRNSKKHEKLIKKFFNYKSNDLVEKFIENEISVQKKLNEVKLKMKHDIPRNQFDCKVVVDRLSNDFEYNGKKIVEYLKQFNEIKHDKNYHSESDTDVASDDDLLKRLLLSEQNSNINEKSDGNNVNAKDNKYEVINVKKLMSKYAHLLTHDKPYGCHRCPETFKNKDEFNQHHRKNHPNCVKLMNRPTKIQWSSWIKKN